MTSNALVPYLTQEIPSRPLPQLCLAGSQGLSCEDEPCVLITLDTATNETKTDLSLFADEHFTQRSFKSVFLPPPVGRNWRGYKQEPSSIKSNLRFSGTYGMEGSFLTNRPEKGIYIDFFS